MNKILKLALISIAAGTVASIDNTIKEKVEAGTINNGVIEKSRGFAEIEKHHNRGIPMNHFSNHTKKITLISEVVLTVFSMYAIKQAVSYDDLALDAANTLILGGAVSNTYDRIKRGYVVDYLKIGRKRAIYNISDFCIIGGALLTLIKAVSDSFRK